MTLVSASPLRFCHQSILSIVVLSAVAHPGLANSSDIESATAPQAPSRSVVSRAIDLAASYLERACGSEGKFVYEININSGRESESYNIIRHAGAIYALGMYNDSHPDRNAVDTMTRAADYMRKHYMGPGIHENELIIWSRPLDEISTWKKQYAELGGTALGLVALAELRKTRPDTVSLEQLQGLGRTLITLQNRNGSFVHKYSRQTGPVRNWHSLYYPGEAALALTYLYEADHSAEWLVAAGKALSSLAKTRAGLSTVPADHWALIATARLLPNCKNVPCGASGDELIRHAVQICNSILQEQLTGTVLDGVFDPTGRIAPTATRVEALLSGLEFLPNDEERRRVENAANRGVAFLLRVQIKFGINVGGMPGASVSNVRDASRIRIDYLQHALCAWLRFESQYAQRPLK